MICNLPTRDDLTHHQFDLCGASRVEESDEGRLNDVLCNVVQHKPEEYVLQQKGEHVRQRERKQATEVSGVWYQDCVPQRR
jgi:hypothetical protein